MVEQDTNSIADLYRRWRGGDATAGTEMAKRFSDWYYAIAVLRLGEVQGRAPLVRACDAFARDIVTIQSSSKLVEWAHGIIQTEMSSAGPRIPGGDLPNTLTKERQPSVLLQGAWNDLPHDQLLLLAHTFSTDYPAEALLQEAEQAGGFPFSILRARYELKKWLKEKAEIPFQVVLEVPDHDLAPLPLYEASRLASTAEEVVFEQWVLTRFDLCRDLAEFSPFVHAMRGGALATPPPPVEESRPVTRAPLPTALRVGFWGLFIVLLLVLIVVLFVRFVL